MKNFILKGVVVFTLCCTCVFGVYGTLSGERSDGLSKTCYYNTPEGTKAISINSYEMRPVSYNF